MIEAVFERPIVLLVGLGFPRELNSTMDALQILNELPPSYYGPKHTAAVKACRAALEGYIDAEAARGVVEAYVKARGLLVEQPLAHHAMAPRADLLGA